MSITIACDRKCSQKQQMSDAKVTPFLTQASLGLCTLCTSDHDPKPAVGFCMAFPGFPSANEEAQRQLTSNNKKTKTQDNKQTNKQEKPNRCC